MSECLDLCDTHCDSDVVKDKARIEWLVNYAADLEEGYGEAQEALAEALREIEQWSKIWENHQDCGDSAKVAAENVKLKEALKNQAEKHKL